MDVNRSFLSPKRIASAFILKRHTGSLDRSVVYISLSRCPSDTVTNSEFGHGRFCAGRGSAPPPGPFLVLLLPNVRLPPADPAARPGSPCRPLHSPPMRLGLHGHHLHAQAGSGPAVLQRLLGERRAGGRQLRRALHVPDPHGDLGAGPGGEKPEFYFLCVGFKPHNKVQQHSFKCVKSVMICCSSSSFINFWSNVANAQCTRTRTRVKFKILYSAVSKQHYL